MHAAAFRRAIHKRRYGRRVVGPLLVIAYGLFPWADTPCCQEALVLVGGLWLLYATFPFPYDFLEELGQADTGNGNHKL